MLPAPQWRGPAGFVSLGGQGAGFHLKNHKTSVKMLLAEFPSQAVQERPALLTNRKPMPPLKVWPEL